MVRCRILGLLLIVLLFPAFPALAVDVVPPTRPPAGSDTDHEFDAGSKIETGRLSPVQIENLVLLGKVWGFLKYHHPRVTSGSLQWDYELFRVLPSVLDSRTEPELRDRLCAWLRRVGEPESCRVCAAPADSAYLESPVAWIRDRTRLGDELSGGLQRIYRNRHAEGEQAYVALNPRVGNPDFSRELSYSNLGYPDAGFRLLALYRFWNIIEYWFPYRADMKEDWDRVLAEFIPRLMGARTSQEYQLELMAVIARVHDTHANLLSAIGLRPPSGGARLPVFVRFIEDRCVVTGFPAADSAAIRGLQLGDVIRRLDGVPVDTLVARRRPYYGASNAAALKRDLATLLTWGPPGPCRIAGERPAGPFEMTAQRIPTPDSVRKQRQFHDLPGETLQLLAPDVAYLKLSSIKVAEIPSYLKAADKAAVLIVDIRNYPGQFVPFALGGHLIDEKTPFARFTVGDLANPGAFVMGRSFSLAPVKPRFSGMVAVLVDESTQSQAEYTTMALQAAPRILVVGSTTAGADGNVSEISFPGGHSARISGIGVYYPDGRPTQRVGIIPDLEVRPTIAGIRAGRDEVLEAAVKRIVGRDIGIPVRADR